MKRRTPGHAAGRTTLFRTLARKISVRASLAAVAAALAALLAQGCGESGNENLLRVNLLLDWKPQMEQAGFIVAQEKGYYAEAGLDVVMHEGQGATTTAVLVGSGQYNLGLATGGATIIARARGVPVVSLALINQHSPTVIFALESSGITSPSDLIGKRLGLTQTGVKFDEYRALMNRLGIDRSLIDEVDVGKSVAPLLAGTVDALLGYTEDQPVLVELRGMSVVRLPMHRYGVDMLSTNVITNEEFLGENPDVCRRFVQASLRGWKRAVEHPEEAVMIYTSRYPESDENFVRANFQAFTPILFGPAVDSIGLGGQRRVAFRNTEQMLFELGIIEGRVNVDSAFTNTFLSNVRATLPAE